MDEQVGTVELLRERIYPLDPQTADHMLSTSVVVPAGIYPVYRDVMAYYWMMTGRINARGTPKIGDGIFSVVCRDEATGPVVIFPSMRFGPRQFTTFMAEPTCIEDHPDQRLRFILTEPHVEELKRLASEKGH